MKRRSLPPILAMLVVTAGCHVFDDDRYARIVPFERVGESGVLAVTEPDARVFLDEVDWQTFWAAHRGGDAPAVDFQREMVIGLFWGRGYSGCTNLAEAIREIREGDGRVVVEVDPLNDLGLCDMIVLPNQVVRLERIDKPIQFEGAVPGSQPEPLVSARDESAQWRAAVVD
jgi:hypothetical protein